MKSRRIVIMVLATVLLLNGCGKKDEPKEDPWKEFTSQEGKFSVDMPGEPTYSKQTAPAEQGTVDIHMFLMSHGVMAYGVMYNDVSGEITDVQQFLDERGNAAVKTSGGSQVIKEKISINGYPGLELKFETSNNMQYTGRLYMVEGRLYQVITTAPAGMNADAATARLMDSFKLLK